MRVVPLIISQFGHISYPGSRDAPCCRCCNRHVFSTAHLSESQRDSNRTQANNTQRTNQPVVVGRGVLWSLAGLIVVSRTQLLVCNKLLARMKHTHSKLHRKYKIPVVVWRWSPSPGPALGFVFSPSRLELLLRHFEHVPDRFVRLSVRLLSLCQVLQRKK